MFWILRRTGAANFFNSLNNNCSTSKGHGSSTQATLDKYVKRPPRKAYGRLSADSDDGSSAKHKIDDPFDEIDNFSMIKSTNGNAVTKNSITEQLQNGCNHQTHHHHSDIDNGGGGGIDGDESHCLGLDCCSNGNLSTNSCVVGTNINNAGHCSGADCQGNCIDSNPCELNLNNLCSGAMSTSNGIMKANTSSLHLYNKEVNENTINRLQAMAMSDDEDYDESLTCNVCDRAFHCHRQLASHQQKKRHFGCGGCDSLFPSLMLLEHHKEEFEHWSDDEISRRVCCRRNRGDDYFTDTDSFTSEAESEDLERLL